MTEDHFQHILSLHFHPQQGSPYWLARQRTLGFPVTAEIRHPTQLPRLGPMDLDLLRRCSLNDLLPQKFHGQRRLITGETSGTTGQPKATHYFPEEFQAAFVTPFMEETARAGVEWDPSRHWLWIGPSGPHIIGKAASAVAQNTTLSDGFTIDFDPRWYRKLAAGSFAQQRYRHHLLEQSLTILARQEIGYLFTTPVVLTQLAATLTDTQRDKIAFLYLGGMAVTQTELASYAQAFPRARRLVGYGNTLFGVCHQRVDGPLCYWLPTGRLLARIVDDTATELPHGQRGQVVMSRLDESCLLINVFERDWAVGVQEATLGLLEPSPMPVAGVDIPQGIY